MSAREGPPVWEGALVWFGRAGAVQGLIRARVLRGWLERLRGLLGTGREDLDARPVLLARCASVHTFGMRYALDVALVDGEGLVVGSWKGLPPGRVVWARGARHALERPSSVMPWPMKGEALGIELMPRAGCGHGMDMRCESRRSDVC